MSNPDIFNRVQAFILNRGTLDEGRSLTVPLRRELAAIEAEASAYLRLKKKHRNLNIKHAQAITELKAEQLKTMNALHAEHRERIRHLEEKIRQLNGQIRQLNHQIFSYTHGKVTRVG
jgi:TolA-binding protein